MKLALFDFDGAITKSDSLIKFIRFAKVDTRTVLGLVILPPVLIFYKLKFIPNYKAKQWLFSYYFKGMNFTQFDQLANAYSLKYIDSILRPEAMEKIFWRKQEGHKVVVVSASIENWINAWCGINELELIATQLEINKSKLSWRLSTENCYGVEKAKRVSEKYNLCEFEYIYTYGDSRGDKELLELADEKFYKNSKRHIVRLN